MKYSSVEEIISSQGFDNIVIGALDRYNLSIPVSFEDFLHEVRVKIFTSVRQKHLDNLSHTTIVYRCVIWTIQELTSKMSKKQRTEKNRITNHDFSETVDDHTEKQIEKIDNLDTLTVCLKSVDSYSRNLLVNRFIHEKKLGELGQKENLTKERIRQKIVQRLEWTREFAERLAL